MTAEARAKNLKVLIFDVDGVPPDGQIFVIPGPDGKGIEAKGFAAHDGLGITLGRLAGLRIGIITKRNSQTVAIRANDLKLEFVYQGQAYKMHAIDEILAKTGYTIDQLAYVRHDIVALPVMRKFGLCSATPNARWDPVATGGVVNQQIRPHHRAAGARLAQPPRRRCNPHLRPNRQRKNSLRLPRLHRSTPP